MLRSLCFERTRAVERPMTPALGWGGQRTMMTALLWQAAPTQQQRCSSWPWWMTGDVGRGMERDGLAGSCIFSPLAYWSLSPSRCAFPHAHQTKRRSACAHAKLLFTILTRPPRSILDGGRKNDDEDDDNDDIVVLATLSACCCLYSHPSHCANGGCGSPFTFTSLSQPPHLRTPHRPHDIAKSVCGRALLQRLARGALWPVTSSFVPRYVRRQIFPCHFNLWPSPSPPKYTKRLQ